jgi:hypothetical protein
MSKKEVEENILTEIKTIIQKMPIEISELKELNMQIDLLKDNDEFSSTFKTILSFLQLHIYQKIAELSEDFKC